MASKCRKCRKEKFWFSDSMIRVSVNCSRVCCDDVRVIGECVVVVNDGQLVTVLL